MPIPENALQSIITDPDSAGVLVKSADQLGKDLKNSGLTTSQIRALFTEVRQIEAQWNLGEPGSTEHSRNRKAAIRRLTLLKPKMAYRARRERGRAVEELVSVLDPALDLVIQEQDLDKVTDNFTRFVEFFEAILAYHKSYGGS